jgi:hypothetical protein
MLPFVQNPAGNKSGGKYRFRISALNAHGPGPWSNPVAVRVK